jgi:IS30 family transposase
MMHGLKSGPRTVAELAEALGAKPETIERAVRRGKDSFARFPSADGIPRIALVERRA